MLKWGYYPFHRKKDYYTVIYEFNLALAQFEQIRFKLVNYAALPLGELDE